MSAKAKPVVLTALEKKLQKIGLLARNKVSLTGGSSAAGAPADNSLALADHHAE